MTDADELLFVDFFIETYISHKIHILKLVFNPFDDLNDDEFKRRHSLSKLRYSTSVFDKFTQRWRP